jgi:uncharacterized membrane protein
MNKILFILFPTLNIVPTITFDQWQEMQRNDPLQKDKQYLRKEIR